MHLRKYQLVTKRVRGRIETFPMSGQVELLGGEGDIWHVSSPSACPATGLECSPPGDS